MERRLNAEQFIQVKCFYLIGKYKKKLKKLKRYKLELKNLFEKKNKEYFINKYLLNKKKEELQKEYEKKKAQLEFDVETLEKKKRIYNEFFVDIFLYQQEHYQCIYKVFKNLLIKKERLDYKEVQLNKLREQLCMCICDKNINEPCEGFKETERNQTEAKNTNLEQLYNLDIDQIYEHIIQETKEGEQKSIPNEEYEKEPIEIKQIQQFREKEENAWNYSQDMKCKNDTELLNESIRSSKLSKSSKEDEENLIHPNKQTLEYSTRVRDNEMQATIHEEKEFLPKKYEEEYGDIDSNRKGIIDQNTEELQDSRNYINEQHTKHERHQSADTTIVEEIQLEKEKYHYGNEQRKTKIEECHADIDRNDININHINRNNHLTEHDVESHINEEKKKKVLSNDVLQNNIQTATEEKPIYFDYNDDFENIYRKYVSNNDFSDTKKKIIDPNITNKKVLIEKSNELQPNQMENEGTDEVCQKKEWDYTQHKEAVAHNERNEYSQNPIETKEKGEKELDEVIETNIVANLCSYFSGNYEDTEENIEENIHKEEETKEFPNESERIKEDIELNSSEKEEMHDIKQETKEYTKANNNNLYLHKWNHNVHKNKPEPIYNIHEQDEQQHRNDNYMINGLKQNANQNMKRSHSVLSKNEKQNETQSHIFQNIDSPPEISYLDLDSEIDYTKMNYNEYETMVSLHRKNTLNKLNSAYKSNSFVNPRKENTLTTEDNTFENHKQKLKMNNPFEGTIKQSKTPITETEEEELPTQWNYSEVDLDSSHDKLLNRSFKDKSRKRSELRNIQELMNSMSYRKPL